MRVLHVIASSRGGGALHLGRLARAQVAQDHRVTVVMPQDGEVTRQALTAMGLRSHDPGPLGMDRVAWLTRLVRRERPRVLHCHGARAAFYARLACLGVVSQRPRVVYSLHGFTGLHRPTPRRQAMWLAERALAPLTDLYVAGSRAELNEARAFGLDAGRLRVVYNGISAERFESADRAAARRRLGVTDDTFVLVSVCRLDQPRDPELFLRALAHLSEPSSSSRLIPCRLILVGDGPLRRPAEVTAAQLGVADRVRFFGYQQDLPGLLAGGDVFLHATTGWEGGVPLAMLEAMAAGLPVIATRAGGIPEGVTHGQSGLLVPVGDHQAMAAAVRRLHADPALAKRLATRGRVEVTLRFTVESFAQSYARLYSDLVSG